MNNAQHSISTVNQPSSPAFREQHKRPRHDGVKLETDNTASGLFVEVRFVDQQSPTYARNKRCEFWVRGSNRGTLETPRHSLPRNTTCLYHLQGANTSNPPPSPHHNQAFWHRPPTRYKVWLSILKFHVSSTIDPQLQEEEECASQLRVWDGALKRIQESTRCNDIVW
jgi:hypothetical protein